MQVRRLKFFSKVISIQAYVVVHIKIIGLIELSNFAILKKKLFYRLFFRNHGKHSYKTRVVGKVR